MVYFISRLNSFLLFLWILIMEVNNYGTLINFLYPQCLPEVVSSEAQLFVTFYFETMTKLIWHFFILVLDVQRSKCGFWHYLQNPSSPRVFVGSRSGLCGAVLVPAQVQVSLADLAACGWVALTSPGRSRDVRYWQGYRLCRENV